MTIVFYLTLHIIGLLCVWPLSRKLPRWFLVSTGFVWGLLLWMFSSLVTLFFNLSYSWLNMGLIILPLLAIAIYYNVKNRTFSLSTNDITLILGSILALAFLSYLLGKTSYVYATTDSFNYIYHGKILAKSGLAPWAVTQFTKLGSFSSIIQMTSYLLPGEYLSGYQTILVVILILVLFIGMLEQLKKDFSPIMSVIATASMALVLGSVTFQHHIFYIHNNLPAGLMLFLALYSFWHYYKNSVGEWNLLGIIALIGFSFTRIEGPLYAILILLFLISIKPQSYKKTLGQVLPYTAATLFWHIYLLTNALQNEQLSQTNLLLIITALAGLTILALISKWIPIIINILPEVLLSIMFFSVLLSIIIETEHMITSITHLWQNLTNTFIWSWTWFIALAFLPVLLKDNQEHPEKRLLLYSLAGYILIVLLLVLARIPFRLGQTDSANRLMLQILPVIFYGIATSSRTLKLWFFPDTDIPS